MNTIKNGVDLTAGFNPYFIGLPILITLAENVRDTFDVVSILILLDYLFLSHHLSITSSSSVVSILILLDYLFLCYKKIPPL